MVNMIDTSSPAPTTTGSAHTSAAPGCSATQASCNSPAGLTLQTLIEKLHIMFESDRVNVDEVQQLMESYKSNPKEWKKYEHFDEFRYTRNLIDAGNGKFNLILLCWNVDNASSIHDHTNAHCWAKIMEGSLREELYDWPADRDSSDEGNRMDEEEGEEGAGMVPRTVTDYKVDQVAYINDSLGLHRVANRSHADNAVSMHLYSPAFDMCNRFDDRTGRKTQCKMTYWSELGVRTPFGHTSSPYQVSIKPDDTVIQ